MIEAFSAASVKKDAFEAGKEAAEKSIKGLSRSPDMIWAFGAISYDQQKLLEGINSVCSNIPVIGCTTDGEISTQGLSTDSIVVLSLSSDKIKFHTACVKSLSRDSFESGAGIGEKFKGLNCKYIQIFSDGLSGNACKILDGIKSILGQNIQIAGGTAGDGGNFTRTWQYYNNQLLTDSLTAVAFEGDFHFSTGLNSGWFPVGTTKTVSRSEGNVVYELDGQPALQVYEKFLGKYASQLPAVGVEYPLGLLGPQGDVEKDQYFLCRATMGVDKESGSITFAGDVPAGSQVKMTMGNENDVIEAARKAAEEALADLNKKHGNIEPKAVFIYSCMARRIVLGSRTGEEIAQVKKIVGKDVPIIGFYTYGEYAPAGKQKLSHFHNETMTLTIIG